MSTEIEKMYRNAGIEQRCISKDDCHKDFVVCLRCCAYSRPPFTAEKQIELIKFLMGDYSWYLDVIDTNNFENSLAASFNDLWQGLTAEEKQQIKEVLEC